MSKLYLVDGMSIVFRAYHAMARSDLKSPEGEPTFAVFGFINIITSLIEKENPEKVIVAFDRREPTFRHKKYPEYKANREAFPEDLVPQLKRIKEFLEYANIPQTELAGYEADDIIGSLSREAAEKNKEAICLTSDKDFYQLVNDKIKLYKPSRKKGEDFDIVDIEAVKKKFGVKPKQVVDVLALIGDSSDNIPGVKGVGEKTAIPLIQKFGSVEELYKNLDKVEKKSVRKKLEDNKENALLSKELIKILVKAPIEIDLEDIERKEPKYGKLNDLFSKLGFRQFKEKWAKGDSASEEKPSASESSLDKLSKKEKKYELLDDLDSFRSVLKKIGEPELLSVDLETSSLDKSNCEIVGIALSAKPDEAYYIAVEDDMEDKYPAAKIEESEPGLFDSQEEQGKTTADKFKLISLRTALKDLKGIFESEKVGKCGQNLKFDSFILKRRGINLTPIIFDDMAASYVLNPDMQHNLNALAKKWLNYEPIPIGKLIGEKKSEQKSMKDLPPSKIKDYACEDADIALKLTKILKKELEKENLLKIAEETEFPLIETLTIMEANGVYIDKDYLKKLSNEIKSELEDLTKKIHDEAGTEFNIDSPKQLSFVLFEKMQIPPVKKTKTGYSTDVQVLNELSANYPIAEMLLNYRQLAKLKSTYIDALPKLINPKSGRLHTTFNQTGTSTGRLSSTDPNLQNIPIRSELGGKVRSAFAAQDKDSVIMAADYSQIELRIMAYYSEDEHLIAAFKNKLDIHSATAAKLFDKPLDEVDQNMRRSAKTVNFGIMYGLGAYGLSQRLGIGRREAGEIIDNYFDKYPGIKKYMDETIKKAREKGYAESMLGRRRYFPDITSANRNIRNAAERAAINMPIQGTAADMMKIAMIRVDKKMRRLNMKSLMTLQVHDELVFEVEKSELDEMKKLARKEMEDALKLGDIPIEVEIGVAKNWLEAH